MSQNRSPEQIQKEKDRLSQYYQKNKVAINARKKAARHAKNPPRVKKTAEEKRLTQKIACANWYLKNREKVLQKSAEYAQNHRKKVRARNTKWTNERYSNDIEYKLNRTIRSRLRYILKKSSGIKFDELIGCTATELKAYLESQFQPGMSWENHSKTGWHVDHIVPLVKFNLQDPEQCKKANHFSNLQPLWATDNLKKGAK